MVRAASAHDAIADGLAMIGRHYPTAIPTGQQFAPFVADYVSALGGYSGEAIAAGFRLALEEAGKFAPKFSEIRTAVIAAAGRLNAELGRQTNVDRDVALCLACGATAYWLRSVPAPDAPNMARLQRLTAAARAEAVRRFEDAVAAYDAKQRGRIEVLHRPDCLLVRPDQAAELDGGAPVVELAPDTTYRDGRAYVRHLTTGLAQR
jgi:hypothetical protein